MPGEVKLTEAQRRQLEGIQRRTVVERAHLPLGLTQHRLWLLERKGLVRGVRYVELSAAGRAALAAEVARDVPPQPGEEPPR